MKVLFVSRGNSIKDMSSLVINQGHELKQLGIKVDFFPVGGQGIMGYYNSIKVLKRFIEENEYDILHVHYGISGLVALMTRTPIPKIISLMGSEILGTEYRQNKKLSFQGKLIPLVVKLSLKYYDAIIVKSKNIADRVAKFNPVVIPNGVSFDKFKPLDQMEARRMLCIDKNKTVLLFPANKNRLEKNFQLFEKAVMDLKLDNCEILWFDNIKHDKTIYYYNAADVVVLTSLHEGSPNVIKEAMACNVPIVSTDVGDVKEVIGDTEGCFVSSFNLEDLKSKLEMALKFAKRTSGREHIRHLESHLIAEKLSEQYKKILTKYGF